MSNHSILSGSINGKQNIYILIFKCIYNVIHIMATESIHF